MGLNTTVAEAIGSDFFSNSTVHAGTLQLGLLDSTSTELSYSSYSRQDFQYSSDGSGVYTLNNMSTSTDPIDFAAVDSGAGSQTVANWGLYDYNGDLVYSQGVSGGSVSVAEGNFPRLAADSLTVTFS